MLRKRHGTFGSAPLLACIALLAGRPASGDVIVLRNGNAIDGIIITEEAETVRVQMPYGTLEVDRRDIREIQRTGDAAALLAHGEQLLYHEHYELALAQFEEALRRDPNDVQAGRARSRARLAYADFFASAGCHGEAIALLREVVHDAEEGQRARERLRAVEAVVAAFRPRFEAAATAARRGDHEDARRQLAELWEAYPTERRAIGKPLALAEALRGDRAADERAYGQAAEHYERALAYDPDAFARLVTRYTLALAHVANDLLVAREFDAAEGHLRSAISFAPDSPILNYLYGQALEAQGRLADAVVYYERVCPDPSDPFDPARAFREHLERARLEAAAAPAATPRAAGTPLKLSKTRSFAVQTADAALGAKVGETLEYHFKQLAPRFDVAAFERRCDVHVHPTRAAFVAATGAAEWSPALSRWDSALGHVTRLEIHTFHDCPQLFAGVLPHELTHILLATRLGYRRWMPLWAHEGLAIGQEPSFHRRYYERILATACRQGRLMKVKDLLAATQYAETRDEVERFYAQSFALATYLLERRTMPEFLAFLDALRGPDDWASWRTYMGFSSPASLQNAWRRWLDKRCANYGS